MGQNPNLETKSQRDKFETALQNIDAIAGDGVEQFSREDKNAALMEIRELAGEALHGVDKEDDAHGVFGE